MPNRPDLKEFLSALNGFLDKEPETRDPGYLRFLEIFCRSVGAGEGHLLRSEGNGGALTSLLSFGMPDFDREFNESHAKSPVPTPLDVAVERKDVVAIVELKPGPDVPPWFLELMDRRGFKSLVAVPLLSQNKPVGALCAYYRDVCLFDQGTQDQLLVMGRMVGSAMESPSAAPAALPASRDERPLDDFLSELIEKPFSKIQVYSMLAARVAEALSPINVVCGPVRKIGDDYALTVADVANVPSTIISRRYALPPFLQRRLRTGEWGGKNPNTILLNEWGELEAIVSGTVFKTICAPISWKNQLVGAMIGWRVEGPDFDGRAEALVGRLARIAALALQAG